MAAFEFAPKEGTTLVQELDPKNYFEVLGRLWDPKDEDYSLASGDANGSKKFREVEDALGHYDHMQHADFPGAGKTDIKLDFIHMRFGRPRILKSRILFPSA